MRNIGKNLLIGLALCAFVAFSSASAAENRVQGSNASKPAKASAAAKARAGKKVVVVKRRAAVAAAPRKPSFGQLAGLHSTQDALELRSSVALVIDQNTNEVLFNKNADAVLPIASLTKLMTGLVISQANLAMDEQITITQADVTNEKGRRSRLKVGTVLSRTELLHLALMSSENRAAHALARTYPGGMPIFVGLMNTQAQSLGMRNTTFVEPTGLSSSNQSNAQDLALLVDTASKSPVLRELSTSAGYRVDVGKKTLAYNNTNRLISNPSWEIGLQKTGYITAAGRCLVMQAKVAGRQLIMVFLDSAGKFTRLGDAERVRRWVEASSALTLVAKPIVQ